MTVTITFEKKRFSYFQGLKFKTLKPKSMHTFCKRFWIKASPRIQSALSEFYLSLFPRRSLLPVYGGCGASEERGWRGDHVHPQLRGHVRGDFPRPERGAQPPPAHLARHR